MKEITPKELKILMDKGNEFQLIDVRDQHEVDLCNIGGDIINFYEILDKNHQINKNKKVILYCRSGQRSATAINVLEKQCGFDNLYNLKGGILKWREDIDSSIPLY